MKGRGYPTAGAVNTSAYNNDPMSTPTVSPMSDDTRPYRELVAAVILQAIVDFRFDSKSKHNDHIGFTRTNKASARYFLESKDIHSYWIEMLNLSSRAEDALSEHFQKITEKGITRDDLDRIRLALNGTADGMTKRSNGNKDKHKGRVVMNRTRRVEAE